MLTLEQRTASLADCITMAVDAGTKRLRCACPGIVQEWNSANQTVSVKIAIKEVLKIENTEQEVEIPMLVDVPVVMPRAGGYCLLMVPQAGDECLVVFSDLCIDAWYQSGGIQSQAERRRHDLSDGFAIMGCWSQVRKPVFPTEGIALQNDAGTDIISIDSEGVHISGGASVKDIDSNDYGVAVGMETTATEEAKKFEVAADHTSYLYGNAELQGSTKITSLTHLGGKVYDTGWVSLRDCRLTAEVDERDSMFDIRRIGDIVHLKMGVTTKKTYNSSTWHDITTAIPEQFRPQNQTFIASYSQHPGGYLGILASGVIQLRNQTQANRDAGFWVYAMGSYLVG